MRTSVAVDGIAVVLGHGDSSGEEMCSMIAELLISVGLVVTSLMSYSLVMALITEFVVHLLRTGYEATSFWKNAAIMLFLALITGAAHLIQIAFWAVGYQTVGAISKFETAFYFSAQSYTALGYGDISLPERWRLLGPLESINGLLLFGLSTAVMFAIMSRLVSNRLHWKLEHRQRIVEKNNPIFMLRTDGFRCRW